jgi:cytochrome c biogenesis protein CcdA
VNRFYKFSGRVKKYFRAIEIFGAILLMVIGFLIFTDNLSVLSGYFV